ncbi:MAG: NB-ARC domain-containing protein [Pseudomonadota bacterium]
MPQLSDTPHQLEKATEQKIYDYWLTQQDIADIARLEYQNYRQINTANSFRSFEIIGSLEQFQNQIQSFKTDVDRVKKARLTLIINLVKVHWTSLVLDCKNKNCVAYYIDSQAKYLPQDYKQIIEANLKLNTVIDFSNFFQQTDNYNCGLWALENAEDITRYVDENRSPEWLDSRIKISRDTNYFKQKRNVISEKLHLDLERIARLSPKLPALETYEKSQKRQKVLSEVEKVNEKLELFVQYFIKAFSERLADYSFKAKGERLTTSALKNELKTGVFAAILGTLISSNKAGATPSLVASSRAVSNRYYPKKKSQIITKAFSTIQPNDLINVLVSAAVEIFQSYEQQFIQVTDKAGDKIAIEKLAEDATERALNYIWKKSTSSELDLIISSELIAEGIVSGESEVYFDPSMKKTRLQIMGSLIQDREEHSFTTANLYEQVGLIIKANDASPIFYRPKDTPDGTNRGYRLPLSWEKNSEGQLNEIYQHKYVQEDPVNFNVYEHILNASPLTEITTKLLQGGGDKVSSPQIFPSHENTPVRKNNLINLRNPIRNFLGRHEVLNELHQLLNANTKSAVITHQLAQLSLENTSNNARLLPEETNQATISGLGGIGKTQLALQYAKRHASDYDHNILWIDAEKRTDVFNSFKKAAIKLNIETENALGQEKELEHLAEDIYAHFSQSKSLFIFDNVEHAKEIEDILPKVYNTKNPTILITSRYSNWKNIAPTLSLNVFTEEEALAFIKTELSITHDAEDAQLKALIKLLQGLPLALQQMVAYIRQERNINSQFSIQDYIAMHHQKKQELLNFGFSEYSNDPYAKTVWTTWKVTIDRIKKESIGDNAINILQIMSFLRPDYIENSIFLSLPNREQLTRTIQLLKNYSMINEGIRSDVSIIHRLVQTVFRIDLIAKATPEEPGELQDVIFNLYRITENFESNDKMLAHRFNFLLHLTEYKALNTNQNIIGLLEHCKEDALIINLLDDAHINLSKEHYFKFIGEAMAVYMFTPAIGLVQALIQHLEKQLDKNLLSLEEIDTIFDHIYTISGEHYKRMTLSTNSALQKVQIRSINSVYDFEKEYLSRKNPASCGPQKRKKRDIASFCSSVERLTEPYMSAQRIKVHFQNVRLITNLASTGFLTKDMLSALIQGDFESVAIISTLLTSSLILGKISNNLLMKGEELAALDGEKLLLQEELNYDGKLASSLFTDEKIMPAAKRQFFGNMRKTAAPFVSRGTSVFFAYNFIKGLNDNQTDNLDNISNAAIVALDVGEAGIEAAEALGYLVGFSAVTGPIGEALTLFIIVAIQFYHINTGLSEIEKSVHLSGLERFKEGLRLLVGFKPSAYLTVKANNNQQVNNAIKFLESHPEIETYVFPTAQTSDEQKIVYLDKLRDFSEAESMPDKPVQGDFFCLEEKLSKSVMETLVGSYAYGRSGSGISGGILTSNNEKKHLYFCKNAIGLKYSTNRTGNLTLIALHDGNDKVIGSNVNTLAVINNGYKDYRLGNADNLFILQGNNITGVLQGGSRINIVKFSDYNPRSGNSVLIDKHSFICGTNATNITTEEVCSNGLKLVHSTKLYGRDNKQDTIFLTKKITEVDTYGGESDEKPDYIFVPGKFFNGLNIILRPKMVVDFSGLSTKDNLAVYKISQNQIGSAHVKVPFNGQMIHQFYCNFSLETLKTLRLENYTLSFRFTSANGYFDLIINDANFSPSNKDFTNRADFIFNENSETIKVKLLTAKSLYIQLYVDCSIDKIIQLYAPMARRLEKAMVIRTIQNEIIAIGGMPEEVLSTDGSLVNHLVGNVGNSVYVIQPPTPSKAMQRNNIIIHKVDNNLLASTVIDTLDLTELLKATQEHRIVFAEQHQNLILRVISAKDNTPIVKIILKNLLIDEEYQDLNIITLDIHPQKIIFEKDEWRLAPISLVFYRNKNIILITENEITQNDELFILKNTGQYNFIRNATDLFLSNAFSKVTEKEIYTVIFSNFFQNPSFRSKTLSLTVTFLDQHVVFMDHQQEINNPTDFNLLNHRMDNHSVQKEQPQLHRLAKRALKASDKVDVQVSHKNKQPVRIKKIHTNFFKPSYLEQTPTIEQEQEIKVKTTRIEDQKNFKEHSKFQAEYQTTTYANTQLFKVFNYLMGRRTWVAQMNKADRAQRLPIDKNGYHNSGLTEGLYWSERQLNEGITRWNNTL